MVRGLYRGRHGGRGDWFLASVVTASSVDIPETSMTNYHYTPPDIPEEHRSDVLRCGSAIWRRVFRRFQWAVVILYKYMRDVFVHCVFWLDVLDC